MDKLDTLVPFLTQPLPAAEAVITRGVTLQPAIRTSLAYDDKALGKTACRLRAQELVRSGVMTAAEAAGDVSFEVVVGQSNFLPARFLDVGALRSKAVCKVQTSGVNFRGQTGSWSGTGFMISPNVMLTNCHVLNSAAVAGNATCIFNFQTGDNEQLLPTKSFRAKPGRLFLTSPVNELDFAFVWVDGEPGNEFSAVPINRSAFQVLPRNFVNIIQHPSGRPKQVSLQENEVKAVHDTVLHYETDTEPGSSGSCVFNNDWNPVALHHASKQIAGDGGGTTTANEGIRFSAIAAQLEKLAEQGSTAEQAAASEILALFGGSDEMLGFFGALGRTYAREGSGLEAVVNSYKGENADIDVGFWNVEWFTRRYQEKVADVAEVIVRMNLDIWGLSESSPNATAHLVATLENDYGLSFGYASSEPNAPDGKQSTTVMWNKRTVTGKRVDWPGEIDSWFHYRSEGKEPGDFADLGLEAVDGKIFDRYPGLFFFEALNRDADQEKFNFYMIPLHLKAMDEGSKRRQLASEILAAAINTARKKLKDDDWVLGGDFNAELATDDFKALSDKGYAAISAQDEAGGAFTYIKRPKSLIDHVFLSASLGRRYGAADFFVVAKDKVVPDFVKRISDHRPVVVRMSLHDRVPAPAGADEGDIDVMPESLAEALRVLRGPAAPKAKGAGR